MYQRFREMYFIHIQGKKIKSQKSHRTFDKYLTEYRTTAKSHSHETEMKSVTSTEVARIAIISFIHYV